MTTLPPAPASCRAEMLRAPAASPPAPEPVLLIIADISGYTRYMTANAKTLSHSQVIITELVEAIVRAVELPLEVAKLEGDAVFLYCRKRDAAHSWTDTRRIIGEKLLTFFDRFSAKVDELSQSTTCTCNACTHIEKLRLKVIVHSGEALFHHVFNFLELAGVDVIVVHRLLKNSIAADQYLLLTEAAHRDLEFSQPLPFLSSDEHYEGIGQVRTRVLLPASGLAASSQDTLTPIAIRTKPADRGVTLTRAWKTYWRLWFAPLANRNHLHRGLFHHIADSTSAIQHAALALVTILLTPFIVPVVLFTVLHHRSRSAVTADVLDTHPSDCDCGRH